MTACRSRVFKLQCSLEQDGACYIILVHTLSLISFDVFTEAAETYLINVSHAVVRENHHRGLRYKDWDRIISGAFRVKEHKHLIILPVPNKVTW